MYLQHFGLAQYPFSLRPNTHFFLKLPSHVETFNQLIKALDGQAGFIKITGEVGTGKTMLCRKVLNALENHKQSYVAAYVPHPILSAEGIMHALAEELGIELKPNISYYDLLRKVTEQLLTHTRENRTAVLFIDEAQAMPEETLEAIRLLSSTSGGKRKLLQVVLFGQPELDALINQPGLHRLQGQINMALKLPALDRDSVETYVHHRMRKAGYSGTPLFSKSALEQLYRESRGIPRLVNVLAHRSLMAAYGKGQHLIEPGHLTMAVTDTESVAPDSGSSIRRLLNS